MASRSADIKLIAAATVGVLLAGFLIAGAALVATRGKGSLVCPELNIGAAADIRQTLENGGPVFQTGGAGCGFWLALVDNDIVAYKADQPQGCTLKLKRDHWECSGVTVADDTLAQYPVAVRTISNIDAVFVDLRKTPPTSTTTLPATTTPATTAP